MSQQLQEFGQTNEAERTIYSRILVRDAGIANLLNGAARQFPIEATQTAPVPVPTPEFAAPVMSQEVTAAVPMQPAPEIPVQPSVEQLSQDAYDLAA